jgi:hypothetical protein
LQIGDTTYAVHECHFDDADGRTCFCVRLRRHAGEVEYQLCLNRDNDLACDCADATYRRRECKHVHAIRDAYADLDRERRLMDFLDDATAELDQIMADCPLCGAPLGDEDQVHKACADREAYESERESREAAAQPVEGGAS